MSNDQTANNRGRLHQLSTDTFALPQELRQAHNFAATAQPIAQMRAATTPPPLRQNHSEMKLDLVKRDVVPTCVAGGLAETDFLIEARLDDDDAPFQAPASWRNNPPPVSSRGHGWHWNERSIAAFLGFAAGIMVIVPAVLYFGAGTEQNPVPVLSETRPANLPKQTVSIAGSGSSIAANEASSGANEVAVANVVPSLFSQAAVPAPVPVSATAALRERQAAAEVAEKRARAALAEGRVAEARDVLRSAASPDTPMLWFILAETYDPRLAGGTAAGGSSDGLAATDVKFARYYYRQALVYGVDEARLRIQTLAQ